MLFTWDEAKRLSNLSKHGLDFAHAHRVFAGPMRLSEDKRYDYGEQRMIAVGQLNTVVVAVVHVESEGTIRIISMRKANKHEANLYYEETGAD